MGYLSIDVVYNKIIQGKEQEKFVKRVSDPKYKDVLQRIKHRATGIASKKGFFYLTQQEFYKTKQEFFTSSLNELHRFNFYRAKPLVHYGAGCISICLALISDHESLIQKIANAGKDLDIPQRNRGSLNHMLQCAMRDDESALKGAMKTYAKYQFKKEWNKLQIEFYEAYLDRNEARIKEVLSLLETSKLKKQCIFHREFIDDYLSVLTTTYLKLCWRKGVEIHIDSPTVPMELMPIEPLEEYKIEYPYLEGWEDGIVPEPTEKPSKVYEEVGEYPESNPSLRSKYVSEVTIRKAVDHFCPRHSEEERKELVSFIWEAYTDPEHFDLKHEDYVRKNASWPLSNDKGEQVLEARPFWSELTEYDDEGFFDYCTSFMIMNEMNNDIDEVHAYLETLKKESDKGKGFFKKLFT